MDIHNSIDTAVTVELGRDYPELREAVARLCESYPGEYWRALDECSGYPTEFVTELTKAGFLGALIPEEYGGTGLPLRAAAVILETINACGCTASPAHAQMYIMGTLLRHGSEAQKQRYLPQIAAGKLRLQAFGVTEPTSGSDTTKLKTRAVRRGDVYVVTGQKVWTSRALHSDMMLLLARTTPLDQVKKKTDGLSVFLVKKGERVRIRRIEEKLGIHGSPTCEIQFNAAPGRLIGTRRRGLTEVALSIMNGARIAIAAQALGIAEAAERSAKSYAQSRVQFGRSIREIPAVYDLLSQMRIKIEAARALTYHSADIVEILKAYERLSAEGHEPPDFKAESKRLTRLATVLTPLAKLYATEIANAVASDAIQVLGGSGYMKDYPVERHFRDARITNIYEGTTQLQVVGAIGGIRSGTLRTHMEQLLQSAAGGKAADLAALVQGLLPELDQSLASVEAKGNDPEFHDLYARWLVNLSLDLFLGTLLTLQAGSGDARKRVVAEAFCAEMPVRVKAAGAYIRQGSRVLISGHRAIVG